MLTLEQKVDARFPWPADENALTPQEAKELAAKRFEYRRSLRTDPSRDIDERNHCDCESTVVNGETMHDLYCSLFDGLPLNRTFEEQAMLEAAAYAAFMERMEEGHA